MEMQHTLANYDELFSCLAFSYEASFHICGKMHRHNIWEDFDYRLSVCRVTLSFMGGSPGELSEELVTQEKRKKGWRMNCDVCEAMEGLENEQ